MEVREKLVELLKTNACPSTFICNPTCKYYGFEDCFPERFADYLIAHGVTVQEWISVDDRLPEPWKQVLIYSRYDFCEVALYIGIPGKWRVTWNHDMLDADSVTHWMPLPLPPKGE